jgi:hypothetical protein
MYHFDSAMKQSLAPLEKENQKNSKIQKKIQKKKSENSKKKKKKKK